MTHKPKLYHRKRVPCHACRKDADFLVFDNDLLTAEHEGFSNNLPKEVYFCGKKMK